MSSKAAIISRRLAPHSPLRRCIVYRPWLRADPVSAAGPRFFLCPSFESYLLLPVGFEPTVMKGRSLPSFFSPMPDTFISSSTLLNAPFLAR